MLSRESPQPKQLAQRWWVFGPAESTRNRPWRSAVRLFPTMPPAAASELGEELRPDRDHPHEQRQRRQRGSLFDENLQHVRLPFPTSRPEHMPNIVLFLF